MAERPLPADPCPDWAQGSTEMFSADIDDVVADRSRIDTLDAGEVLGFLETQRAVSRSVQTNELLLAARLADVYDSLPGVRPADDTDRDRPNRVVLAGEGAPAVHEHAPLELASALGVGPDTARVLMAHALELRHRLPRLWARVETGTVDAWRARQVATQTMSLALDVMDERRRPRRSSPPRSRPHRWPRSVRDPTRTR